MTQSVTIAQQILDEFEIQAPLTRRYLEQLADEHLLWKPHARSMTAGQLALHVALVPGAIARFVQSSPAQAPGFQFPQPESSAAVLRAHDEGVETVRALLPTYDDNAMRATWRLLHGETELLACPRGQFLRDVMLSHWYQHRGQLSVYLRLLERTVPSTWGPSADELPLRMRELQPA